MTGSVETVSHEAKQSQIVPPATHRSKVSPQRAEALQPTVRAEDHTRKEEQVHIAQAVDAANEIIDFLDKKISFSFDRRINRVIVTVTRESTEEVIRQIPPEEMVERMVRLQEDFRGLVLNHTG
jgi:flagellar protein FlaG